MPALKPKDKMVSFRLPIDEYDRLREAAAGIGVSNLSELARLALNQAVQGASSNGNHLTVELQLRSLRAKIDTLSAELDRLCKLLTL